MRWIPLEPWLEMVIFVLGVVCGMGCLVLATRFHRNSDGGHRPSRLTESILSLATGVLFVTTVASESDGWMRVSFSMLWLVLVMMVATDMASMRVPNRVSLSAAVLFVGMGLFGLTQDWLSALSGAFGCSGLLFFIHVLTRGRGMGMGDVKLYVSVGAMLGPLLGMESLIFASAFASLIGGIMLATGHLSRREPFAFVPFIFAGVVCAVYFGPALNSWYSSTFWPS